MDTCKVLLSFLFFAANAFVALCDWIFWCCVEILISSLDQYKQRKHGVWEGTRGAMNTEIQGAAAEIWGQAFGLPQSVVD